MSTRPHIDHVVNGSVVRTYPVRRKASGRPALILLHGLGNTSRMWGAVPSLMKKRFDILAIDIPGFGGSDTPSDGMSPESVARQISDVISLALPAAEPTLVGHSLGGLVALRVASTRQRDEHVVLVSGFPAQASVIVRRPVEGVAHPTVAVNLAAQFLGAAIPNAWGLRTTLLGHPTVRSLALRPFVRRPGALDVSALDDALEGTGGLGALHVLRMASNFDIVEQLSLVKTVDLVVGSADRLHTASDLAHFQDAPGRRLRVLPDVGHWPQLEAPTLLASTLEEVCSSAGAS